MMKRLILFLLLVATPLWSATIYVDPTLVSDITNGTYNKTTRSTGGTDGNAYNTIKDVIWGTNGSNGAASSGDTILLRGATYQESWGGGGGDGAAIEFPSRLSGSVGGWTTLASYPGEWAILDGQNNDRYFVVGLGTLSSGTGYERAYIKLERLEVKNGSSAGIGIVEGPIWVRYCYIHSNGNGAYGDQNRSGLNLRRGRDCIIEYNYFYDNGNGGSDNTCDIDSYADYAYDDSPSTLYPDCNRDNIIRYNRFIYGATGGQFAGYKDKATQYLQNYQDGGSAVSTANNQHGNKLHHNILTGYTTFAIQLDQDFAQAYNNITDGGAIGSMGGGDTNTIYPAFYLCVYNNTVVDGQVVACIGGARSESTLALAFYAVNNINSNSSYLEPYKLFGVAGTWHAGLSTAWRASYDWTGTLVDKNLVYQPNDTTPFGLPNSYWSGVGGGGYITTAAFNTLRSVTNYTSTTSNLFAGSSGANKYILYGGGSFSNGLGGATAATAGVGGNHPYLTATTIPSYLGAVNPLDSDWVAGVIGLTQSYLQSTATNGSTPTWIEGGEPTPTAPTSVPTIGVGGFRTW